jgi:glycosyltransferase involved in cell wall biosynthesis
VPLTRSGLNPVWEWRTFRALRRIYRDEAPDLVHHVTIKPVIYGTLAARAAGVPGVVNAISGLGFIFTHEGFVASVKRGLVNLLYRFGLHHQNMRFIFQNQEDLDEFVAHVGVPRRSAHLIRGSGVDLDAFAPTPEPDGPPTFVLVARMLADKGVREFVAAAQQLHEHHPTWRFQLVGPVDRGNPSSLTEPELHKWHDARIIEWLGYRADIGAVLQAAHVVCLPSYREGLPKSLLEAAAAARPAIASDVPGCRDVVRDGITGLLVPPRDSAALALAMLRLGQQTPMRVRMGRAARERAQAIHSADDVVVDTFLIYEMLLDH